MNMATFAVVHRVALVVTLGATFTAPLQAQLISPKTVPIHQGEQFSIYPSSTPGMGGLSIALHDTLGDPWVNPAKAIRLTSGSIQVMPTMHRATAGGGRSLPVSILQRTGTFSGGALFSMQELDHSDRRWNAPISEQRAANQYFSGVLARQFGNGLSLGVGVSVSDLRGVNGVPALYAGSDRVRQSGGQFDARLGLIKEFAGGSSLELVAVNNKYRMTHDVHYPVITQWGLCPPCLPGEPCVCDPPETPARDEHNLDRTNTAGVHAVFLTPKTDGGWRLGYLLTANRQSHPKIPNYQIQNIPRDPGNTNAFNVGFGATRSMGRSTFGIDAIMEPIRSRTWADAAGDTTDVNGTVIPQGAHTVDNRFRFSNSRINVGFATDVSSPQDTTGTVTLQFGLAMRSINYTLDQTNHVQRTSRSQDEGWTEWTPTMGIRIRAREFELSYGLSMTCGPTCDVPFFSNGDDVSFSAPTAPGGPVVIAAPGAPLTFDGGSSSQHRVMVSIRLR
jgi:hypothetical protein